MSATRAKDAGDKQKRLADLYRRSGNGAQVAEVLDRAIEAFSRARKLVRNELLHAHPFTAGKDDSGAYLPGLAYTAKDGRTWKTLARKSTDLLDLAERIEEAMIPLAEARAAVRQLAVAALR